MAYGDDIRDTRVRPLQLGQATRSKSGHVAENRPRSRADGSQPPYTSAARQDFSAQEYAQSPRYSAPHRRQPEHPGQSMRPERPGQPRQSEQLGQYRERRTGSTRQYSSYEPASQRKRARTPLSHALLVIPCVLLALIFVFCSSLMFHGSAGLDKNSEAKILLAPVEPGYSFAFSTPRSQWQQGVMPHIYQIDPAWSELPYAGGTIRKNACGPTALTMVYIWKTGARDMTPVEMCALAEAGNYAPTGATEWSFMSAGAASLGLSSTALYKNRSSVEGALRSGAAIIASVRPGIFTDVGHYIVLYGIDDACQIGVYDPNSAARSARKWGISEVLTQINAAWAYY